jgi:capsular polysaccharide biosynthesis protein
MTTAVAQREESAFFVNEIELQKLNELVILLKTGGLVNVDKSFRLDLCDYLAAVVHRYEMALLRGMNPEIAPKELARRSLQAAVAFEKLEAAE